MRKLPLLVFLALMTGAAVSCFDSMRRTRQMIARDVDNALAKTLLELPDMRIDADTLAVYRSNISIAEVRDTACLTMLIAHEDSKQMPVIKAESGCSLVTMFMLSDQRASAWLAVWAALWLLCGNAVMAKVNRAELTQKSGTVEISSAQAVCVGTLTLDTATATFIAADGSPVRFTPMQQQLMEMFFRAPCHTLAKQDICAALWPNKPDATDTLYALIKRLKPILEATANLRIESDRSKSYRLTV